MSNSFDEYSSTSLRKNFSFPTFETIVDSIIKIITSNISRGRVTERQANVLVFMITFFKAQNLKFSTGRSIAAKINQLVFYSRIRGNVICDHDYIKKNMS